MNTETDFDTTTPGVDLLVETVQRLSLARDVETVREIVRRSARRLAGADGATFVLRDGDLCHYVDEDAIGPLWKGQRFPMSACISGWAMLNRQAAVIEDIYVDERIPHDAYRPTFVKSLVMVPIRRLDPLGAIGAYWATRHRATAEEVRLLQALADTTAVALENVRVFTELEERVRTRTSELETANRELRAAHEQADRVFGAFTKALPGTVLDGKYRLEEELGVGGFGAVFRGRHLTLNCPIAVKVFRPAPGNDSAVGLQRFLREGAVAARISHPNAVRVHDSGVSGEGIAYLVMELLRGRSLAEELRACGALATRRAVTIAARVADVLAEAHRRGVLHRDIKPDNIFLHRDGDTEIVKVVDFGIATYFTGPDETAAERLTRTGEYIGTPVYVAPERVGGEGEHGASDVFSLAAVLYEMLSGVPPWTKQEYIEMAAGARDCQPKPLLSLRRSIPAVLEAHVRRALSWELAERPSAQEFAADLTRLAATLDDDTSARNGETPPSIESQTTKLQLDAKRS
jgi:serine/threonine protein kinase